MRPWGRAATTVGLAALVLGGCQEAGPLPGGDSQPRQALARPGDDWLTVGSRALDAGEYDLAMKAFETSMLVEGITADALTGAGIAAQSQGLNTMAAEYFSDARDMAPESIVANNNLGVVLYRLKEYYPARQAFQAAFALSGGRNELAIRNLRLVENAIAEIESMQTYVDPAINFDVRRLGSSEFELVESEPPTPVTGGAKAPAAAQDDTGSGPQGASPPGT